MSRQKLKLFWCSTPDHSEDWFMVATSSRQAASMHTDFEGYGPGEAKAKLVVEIPMDRQHICMHCGKPWTEQTLDYPSGRKTLREAKCASCDESVIGWPSDVLLEACGGKVIDDGPDHAKVVILGGRKYVMGDLDVKIVRAHDDIFEKVGKGRPNGTTPQRSMN